MKRVFIISLMVFYNAINAQVGINTTIPKGSFHVDGAKDNPITGNPSASQSLNDFVILTNGNVGIKNTDPQKSLDVNANGDAIRIRQLANTNDWTAGSNQILVRTPSNGDVNSINYVYKASITLLPGTNQIISIPTDFNNSVLMLSSGNTCGRTMVSSFGINGRAINFLGGIARDVEAQRQITPIPTGSTGSATWTITFPNVLSCSGDGTGTQFDYIISKPTDSSIALTNQGDVARTFQIVLKRY